MNNSSSQQELLYFWAIGDMHYRAVRVWNDFHEARMSQMFKDLEEVWNREGRPAFCVSPGDIVDKATVENYQLARESLAKGLQGVPFYPGIGNHEYSDAAGAYSGSLGQMFTDMWNKPLRYHWQSGETICIMLDYPNPSTFADPTQHIAISQETLIFLDQTLDANKDRLAIIFIHCPLSNTVLDRDPVQRLDYSSQENFFSPDNSQELRYILARHKNAFLYLSGHTHSGWETPNIVVTENLGNHPLTSVNLMSPWYTGRGGGACLNGNESFSYKADEPNVITSFSIHVYLDHAIIRCREHRERTWLKEWRIPVQ